MSKFWRFKVSRILDGREIRTSLKIHPSSSPIPLGWSCPRGCRWEPSGPWRPGHSMVRTDNDCDLVMGWQAGNTIKHRTERLVSSLDCSRKGFIAKLQ